MFFVWLVISCIKLLNLKNLDSKPCKYIYRCTHVYMLYIYVLYINIYHLKLLMSGTSIKKRRLKLKFVAFHATDRA